MKTRLLLMGFLFSCSFTYAQQFKMGISGGVNLSQTPSERSDFKNNGAVSGYQAGFNVYYELQNNWSVMSGLSFIKKGGNQKLSNDYFAYVVNETNRKVDGFLSYHLDYVSIPLKVGYRFKLSENFALLPKAGLNCAYGFDGNINYSADGGLLPSCSWKPFSGLHMGFIPYSDIIIDKFDRFDMSASVGLEARLKDHYIISLDYDYGLKKIHDDFDVRSSALQFSVGYIF